MEKRDVAGMVLAVVGVILGVLALVLNDSTQDQIIADEQALDVCLAASSIDNISQPDRETIRDYCITVYDWRQTE